MYKEQQISYLAISVLLSQYGPDHSYYSMHVKMYRYIISENDLCMTINNANINL